VRSTGRPDKWVHHDHSKPPKDQPFEELLHFEIPDQFRETVGMATCPICSPGSPKYFEGALAWFPLEGVLRAIGHECAKRHFGALHNAAVHARKVREETLARQNFLLFNLPSIAGLRREVETMSTAAKLADAVRNNFWLGGTQKAWKAIARQGAGGRLVVERTRTVDGVNIYGKDKTAYTSEIIASYPVVGLKFLGVTQSLGALAENTRKALELIHAMDEDEVVDFVDRLGEGQYLLQAYTLAQRGVDSVGKLRDELAQVRALLDPDNLANLSDWTLNRESGSPVTVIYNLRYPARIDVRGGRGRRRSIPIPPELR